MIMTLGIEEGVQLKYVDATEDELNKVAEDITADWIAGTVFFSIQAPEALIVSIFQPLLLLKKDEVEILRDMTVFGRLEDKCGEIEGYPIFNRVWLIDEKCSNRISLNLRDWKSKLQENQNEVN